MSTWPTSLPQYVLEEGFSERIQDQNIETPMDVGLAKVRRRFTKTLRTLSCTLQLTAAQRTDFETFWGVTCAGGSLPFTWKNPITQATVSMRFRSPAPAYTSLGGGAASRVSFTVEII